MSDRESPYPAGADIATATRGGNAGEMLRGAREGAGLSLEAVSQQLKLAPRQVRALEDGDLALLPGRTFVRGFARNYARVLGLDPQAVLDALPGSAGSSTPEVPTLPATAVAMGHLPSPPNGRPGRRRWTLALVIFGLVAAAATYVYLQGDFRRTTSQSTTPAITVATSDTSTTGNTSSRDVALPLPMPSPAAPDAGGNTGAPHDAPVPAAGVEAGRIAPVPTESAAIAPITLTLRGSSWVEITDGSGRVVISQTLPGGETRAVPGAPPFDVVIGNAPNVVLSFRGQPIDLGPHTRQNVARLTLQ
ncbi:MAG: RodZ family helix-turn-helix domain-containing protein [Betaproteobacteria bacterium]